MRFWLARTRKKPHRTNAYNIADAEAAVLAENRARRSAVIIDEAFAEAPRRIKAKQHVYKRAPS